MRVEWHFQDSKYIGLLSDEDLCILVKHIHKHILNNTACIPSWDFSNSNVFLIIYGIIRITEWKLSPTIHVASACVHFCLSLSHTHTHTHTHTQGGGDKQKKAIHINGGDNYITYYMYEMCLNFVNNELWLPNCTTSINLP